MSAFGALIGLIGAAGLLLIAARVPWRRRIALADRIEPYLSDTVPVSTLLSNRSHETRGVLAQLCAPVIDDLARRLDALLGRRAVLRRRLELVGSPLTVDGFRQEQVLWGAAGAAVAVALMLLGLATGSGPAPFAYVGLVVLAAGAGFYGREVRLQREIRRHEEAIERELPAVAELLALAVGAGESPIAALERVVHRRRGVLAEALHDVLGDVRAGTPFAQALSGLTRRSAQPTLVRFTDGLAVALQRGTPLADVLRAQALDVRDAARRQLMEAGGRKEIAMMVPVVFLVLPVTILFALYPGAVTLTSITQ